MDQDHFIDKQNPLLIYLHIPKTGGTTLTNIICNQYSKNVHYDVLKNEVFPSGILADKDNLIGADTLCGHFLFGVHNYIPRRCTYISMLRNPVEQVISWFYFKYKNPMNQDKDTFEGTLEEYINNEEFNIFTVNYQTRYVIGDLTPKDFNLDIAKENLKKYFSVVGVTELFDESIYLMKKELGWKDISYKKLNVNSKRPLQQQISQKILNKIIEKNEIDIQLYDFVKKELENRINTLDSQ